MTVPRRVIPGDTLMLSRRCLGRRFRLRPSKLTNQLVAFILAVAAERYGILVHCFCVLSNHLHLVVTDPLGTSPAFMRDVCALIARSLNAAHGTWETFWAPGSYSAVTLCTADDILDKMAYVLANPAAAGLVRRSADWPGLWSAPGEIDGPPLRVDRPDHFFREDGPMPGRASLRLVRPPGLESTEDLRGRLEARIAEREAQVAQELSRSGRTVLGVRKVVAQSPFGRPVTRAPHRGLRPRIAAADKWKRLEAIGRLKEFLRSYRAAWCAFRRGLREAVFPHGTYWMRVTFGVACASSD